MRRFTLTLVVALALGHAYRAQPALAAPWFEAPWHCHGADARAIGLADVTGDGHLDVVGAATVGLQVLAGDGDGSLQPAADIVTGRDGTAIAIADLDTDGRADVVLASASHSTIDVFMGTPAGLAAPVTHAIGGPPLGVAIADMDRDGHLDVVLGGYPIRILRGDGHGGLSAPAGTGVNGECAVGDVDGDAWPDLAVIAGTEVRVMISAGGTSFVSGAVRSFEFEPMVVGLADLDGDVDLDLVTGVWGATVFVFPNDGTGGFQPQPAFGTDSHGGPTGFRIGFGEVNGDGITDLVAAFHAGGDFTHWVEVRSSMGYSKAMIGELVRSIAVGDLDEDGAADLVTAGSCGVGVSLNRGDGQGFGPKRLGPAGFVGGLAAGDVDGDGRSDLAWFFDDYSDDVVVMLDPTSSSLSILTLSPSRPPTFVGMLDLDSDGHAEVLAGTRFGVSPLHTFVSVHRWDGSAFEAGLEFQAAGDTVHVGDLDDDGLPDAVVHGWQFLPGGGFAAPRPIASGSYEVIADFDDDGFDDRATTAVGWTTARIDRGSSSGYQTVEWLGLGDFPRGFAAGDFDGDGRTDLAAAVHGTLEDNQGVVFVLRNQSAAATASAPIDLGSIARLDRSSIRARNPERIGRALELELMLPRSGRAALALVDPAGRVIARDEVVVEAGRRTSHSSFKPTRPGVYWIRVEQGGRTAARKVVVIS